MSQGRDNANGGYDRPRREGLDMGREIARRSLVAEPAEPATWLFWLLAQGRSPKTVDQGGNFWDDLYTRHVCLRSRLIDKPHDSVEMRTTSIHD